MKKIAKILPLLVLIAAFIDNNLNLLKDLGLSEEVGNWIKFAGLVLTSLLPSLLKGDEKQSFAKTGGPEEKEDDGAVTPGKGF